MQGGWAGSAGLALLLLLPAPGEIQTLTPSIEALYTPSIDEALDEEQAKREFWRSFRVLGDWYSDFPPY